MSNASVAMHCYAECELQRRLLEQAEAIWQGQHEELSSELAQAQRDAQHACAALQRKQDTALETLQVSRDHT